MSILLVGKEMSQSAVKAFRDVIRSVYGEFSDRDAI